MTRVATAATPVGQQPTHRTAGDEAQRSCGGPRRAGRRRQASGSRRRCAAPPHATATPATAPPPITTDLSRRHDREQDQHPEDDGTPAADGGAVSPGETRTRMRRYIVTEHVTQTVEELPDDDRG